MKILKYFALKRKKLVNIRYKAKENQENILYFRFKTLHLQSNSVLHLISPKNAKPVVTISRAEGVWQRCHPNSCRNAATYVHLYTCRSQALQCRVEQQLNNMKKFAVLKQLYNYSPRVLEMFDEREDAELYVTLMKKTNKDTDAFEYNVFEMSK